MRLGFYLLNPQLSGHRINHTVPPMGISFLASTPESRHLCLCNRPFACRTILLPQTQRSRFDWNFLLRYSVNHFGMCMWFLLIHYTERLFNTAKGPVDGLRDPSQIFLRAVNVIFNCVAHDDFADDYFLHDCSGARQGRQAPFSSLLNTGNRQPCIPPPCHATLP